MVTIRDFAANGESIYSWGRYLYWADLRQRDWHRFMADKGAGASKVIPEWLGVSCYWASSLYVVIEGWETAKFKDPIIDALLGIPNRKAVLKKLRNGTFHYLPDLISPKLMGFLELSNSDSILWLHFLHEEFCRWLRDRVEEMADSALISPEQSQEWRNHCAELFGWLPLRPAEEKLKALKQRCAEIERELDASGDTSEAAQNLRASLGLCETATKETGEAVREYRRTLLAKLGLNPDDYIP